jgi:hypothetical protein
MNRRWIAVAIVTVAIIGVANIFILLVLVPRWSKAASTTASAGAPPAPHLTSVTQPAAAAPAAAIASPPAAAVPVTSTVATTSQPAAAPAPHHPAPLPVQAGLRLERQMLTPSGHVRVRYLRDRQQKLREITLQDAQNPANETVLAEYHRNAWVVASPNDDWLILIKREKNDSDLQLFHRVSSSPLKYEVPQELRVAGSDLRDMIWQTYLEETQQDPNLDRRQVTFDATAWDPASQKVTLAVSPLPSKDPNASLPVAWTCLYDVNAKQLEPAEEPVAEGPPSGNPPETSNETASGAPNEMVAGEDEQTGGENGEAAGETQSAPSDEQQDLEGERFPATRQQEITVAEADELDLVDVKYAIFEMFARHGAEIHDHQMAAAFSKMSWYQAKPGFSFDDAEAEFSEVEKHNLNVLRRVRDAKVAAARRLDHRAIKGQPVEEPNKGEQFIRGVLQGVSDAVNGGDQ